MAYMYYVNYKANNNKVYNKIYNKIFYRYEIINFDQNKRLININKNFINKRIEKKIDRFCIEDSKSESYGVLISNDIKLENNIKNISDKVIMKYMVCNIIEYIEEAVKADFRNEEIHILINSDEYIGIILDISEKFRCVNIVTDKIKKLRRLESKLNKNDRLLFSISNNRKKALKRCKILINIDFTSEQLEEFSINRNSIIINLNKEHLKLKNSFHGTVIENIDIKYNNRHKAYINEEKFDSVKLYESYICSKEYVEAKKCIQEDNCNINKLKGSNSSINSQELKNNFTKSSIKLDKKQKKD